MKKNQHNLVVAFQGMSGAYSNMAIHLKICLTQQKMGNLIMPWFLWKILWLAELQIFII